MMDKGKFKLMFTIMLSTALAGGVYKYQVKPEPISRTKMCIIDGRVVKRTTYVWSVFNDAQPTCEKEG